MEKATTKATTTEPNTTTESTTANTFETLKRAFETEHASGQGADALQDLATAVAYSVLRKCIDPQRKTAANRETVSNNGNNPALTELKRGIAQDRRALANTAYCAERATRTTYTADGDIVQEIADRAAYDELAKLIDKPLSDGLDLVQTAALALLEQAAEHAESGEKWLDRPYTVKRLARRVYIQAADSAAYRTENTTPIQEAYRAVRKAVQESRATQTDPRNGYCYIEDLTADGLDTIYYRLGKYADMGGTDSNGLYTTDKQSLLDYNDVLARLNLSERQATIVRLRMQGRGYKAIASYLGVTFQAVQNAMRKVQAKADKIGFNPSMWAEMNAE